jgi:polysaccharide deacetylase 2 family uncharacterized protein YibQ
MELVKVAKLQGSALGIGHPHISTINVLSQVLKDVDKYGVKLISVKSLVQKRTKRNKYAQSTRASSAGM